MQCVASSSRTQVQILRTISIAKRGVSASAQKDSSGSQGTSTKRKRRSDPQNTTGMDLIAPPDPISNLRPIIYACTPSRRRTPNSPYSTEEFPTGNGGGSLRLAELELEWRLQREKVDAMNHHFWAGINQEFNAQLAHRLAQLPPQGDPPSAEDIRRRDETLSQFYADWQVSNRVKMNKWVWEWWGDIWAGLRMQSRIYMLRLLRR